MTTRLVSRTTGSTFLPTMFLDPDLLFASILKRGARPLMTNE